MVMRLFSRHATKLVFLANLLMLSSCSVVPSATSQKNTESVAAKALDLYKPFPLIGHSSQAPSESALSHWQHRALPGKQITHYRYEWMDERHTVLATATMSASMLRQSVHVEPSRLGRVKFSWKVPALIAGADLTLRETHDSPVRLVLAFEGDRSKFSMKNSMLSELALALTGEALPYATLMYVWCNTCSKDEVLLNPRTDRIREIALESGPEQLGQWRGYERDIRADFEKAFGEQPGALVDIGLMTDTDNTKQNTKAWYGAVSLSD